MNCRNEILHNSTKNFKALFILLLQLRQQQSILDESALKKYFKNNMKNLKL